MANSALRALVLASNFAQYGVDGIVTRPDEEPIEARVLWVTPQTDGVPTSSTFQRRDQTRVVGLLRSEVPTAPIGTIVEAPDVAGGASARYRVDSTELVEVEHIRVSVVPDPLED